MTLGSSYFFHGLIERSNDSFKLKRDANIPRRRKMVVAAFWGFH